MEMMPEERKDEILLEEKESSEVLDMVFGMEVNFQKKIEEAKKNGVDTSMADIRHWALYKLIESGGELSSQQKAALRKIISKHPPIPEQ